MANYAFYNEDVAKRALLNLGLEPSNLSNIHFREHEVIHVMFTPALKEVLSMSNWFFLKQVALGGGEKLAESLVVSYDKQSEYYVSKDIFGKMPPWALLCVELHLTLRIASSFKIAATKMAWIDQQLRKALNEANYLNSIILHSEVEGAAQ